MKKDSKLISIDGRAATLYRSNSGFFNTWDTISVECSDLKDYIENSPVLHDLAINYGKEPFLKRLNLFLSINNVSFSIDNLRVMDAFKYSHCKEIYFKQGKYSLIALGSSQYDSRFESTPNLLETKEGDIAKIWVSEVEGDLTKVATLKAIKSFHPKKRKS